MIFLLIFKNIIKNISLWNMESRYLLRSFIGDIISIPTSEVEHKEWKDSLSKIIAKNDSSVPHWTAVHIGLPSVMDGSVLFPYIVQPLIYCVEICYSSGENIYDEDRNSLIYYQFCIEHKYEDKYEKIFLYNFELYHRVSKDEFILYQDIKYYQNCVISKIERVFSSLVDVLDHFSIHDEIKEIVISKWEKKDFSRI